MEELVTKITPGRSLFRLLLYMILLGVSIQLILMGLGLLVMKVINPDSPLSFSFFQENIIALKGMLLISSITTFILPAWILYRSESGINRYFERIKNISFIQ